MGRFASAIAFLATLVIVLLAAGCGQRFDRAPGNAPPAGDLAADALAALQDAGSAHFVAEVTAEEDGEPFSPMSVRVEGDASATAVDAQGTVTFGGVSLQGRVLAGEDALFVQFGGSWYGEEGEGISDAFEEAQKEHDGAVWNELATPEGLRRNFGELFEGEVTEGPVVDGAATWQFDGHLDADGILDFARRFEADPPEEDLDEFRVVAEASHVLLVVGQDDHLPRRLEVSLELSDEALEQLDETSPQRFKATLELSEFGKPVEIEAPADFKPFDELFASVFGSWE
jgi:LppX_LprAFG lipoprotein